MKKYRYLLFLSLVTLVILVIISIHTIISVFRGEIFASTFISPLLTISNLFITSYLSKKSKRSVLTKYQYDSYFTDRESEFISIEEFIYSHNEPICFIDGITGIGKSMLLKEIADRINDNKYHFEASAIYIKLDKNKSIENNIAELLDIKQPISVMEICKRLKKEKDTKWVLLLDDVDDILLLSAKDFASSIYNYGKVKTIISFDGKLNVSTITPTLFCENIIKALSNKYSLKLTQDDLNKINSISQGLPVYIRFLLNQYKSFGSIDINSNSDLKTYINTLIKIKMNELQRKLLSLICCLMDIGEQNITINKLLRILPDISPSDINTLENLSLIGVYAECVVVDYDISCIYSTLLSNYRDFSYIHIYNYYINFKKYHDYALIALLKSSKKLDDTSWIFSILMQKIKTGDYPFIIRIGQLDKTDEINPHILSHTELYQFIQIEYFKALLEQGLYNEAQDIIKTYDFIYKWRKGVVEIQSESDFAIHYAIANLYHLTNRFEDAITYCDVLSNKCQSKENNIDITYLRAHCLRHIGHNFNEAFNLFKKITDDQENFKHSPKIYIRAAYSLVSIQMLWGTDGDDFIFSFSDIYKYSSKTAFANSINPYIDRHYIRYLAYYEKNLISAIKKAEETLDCLEKTSSRIKYDFYFELGELYRIVFEETLNFGAKKQSLNYYTKAIAFSIDSHDYNLMSACELGKVLLLFREEKENMLDEEEKFYKVNEIKERTKSMNLLVNYYYAIVIEKIIRNSYIDEQIIQVLNMMNYKNLYESARAYNAGEKYTLKLIVM